MNMQDFILFLVLLVLFIGMVLFLNLLDKKKIAGGEITRKMGHLILGGILLLLPCFEMILYPILLCFTIAGIIFLSSKSSKLPCADSVQRKTHGTYLYPIGILLCFCISKLLVVENLFYISILILIFSDVFSAMVGQISVKKQWTFLFNGTNKKIYRVFNKTIYGSMAFLFSTLIILFLYFGHDISIMNIVVLSMLITLSEMVSTRGFDNVVIPVVSILLLYAVYFII